LSIEGAQRGRAWRRTGWRRAQQGVHTQRVSVPPDGVPPSVGEPREAPQPQTDLVEDADVHAFLIADVRGYTAFTQERGDEGGALLAARFAQVVRSLVEDHRGRVIELRGDEALVVFGSPRSAIRAAVALQQKFVDESIADPSLPLTVGIGLDAGEAVPVEGGFRGAALNVAGRLCSLARAGEVLASREIVHLARRLDGVRFTERGQAQLKGIQQPVHIVAVRSEDRDAAEAIAPFVRSTPPPSTPRWRSKAVVGAVVLAAVTAFIAVPLVTGARSSEIDPNSIGVLDAESGELTATVGLAQRPGSVAASADAVWVTHPDFATVTRIDPEDQEIRDTIQVGENPTGIAIGEDAVWVVESGGPTLSRISPDTNTVVGDPIEVGNGPAGVAVGEGSVWVTNRFDGTVSRIDPDRGEIVEAIPVGLDPRGIAIGFGSVWVGLAGSNRVVRIDPGTNEVTHPVNVGNAPGSLAVSADAVWVVNTLDDTVSAIDPDTNSVAGTIAVGNGPSEVAVVEGTIWVANEADGTLSRIEPGQTSADEVVIGSVPQGLGNVGGNLWVSVRGTASSHQGGTLRLLSIDQPPSLDPGAAYEPNAWRIMHLLGDGLVAFEPIGGTNATLIPDLAISMPAPTDGGRTYTFELRSGIRYSNGEVVAPSDFQRAFERGFSINSGPYVSLYGNLVGGEACGNEPRTCDLSRGVVTDDASGTISFNLLRADPEFLYKLTLPFAYPVPPSTPDRDRPRAGVAGTGPYMLEAPKTRDGLALVRNPHFNVWSQAAQPEGYVTRIAWRFGVEPEAQVQAVIAGDADIAFNADASDQLDEIFVRFPSQVHTSAQAATMFAVLNMDVQPFDDVDVRRAMNLALDRDRVVRIFGGDWAALPTCQQLPPNFPGYEPYCPYTMDPGPEGEGSWSAPDLEEARRIVRRSGTARMRVVVEVWPGLPQFTSLAEYMVELLDDLGYRGSVRNLSFDELYSSRNEFQMVLAGWTPDYPAASNMITNFFTCDGSAVPSAGFCDPAVDALIRRATQMQVDDPATASALWADIDRSIVDQAPYLWSVNWGAGEFVSERVGNHQSNPQWGVLLNQLWVQ
jgi:YVTN family beta-propeller protein